MPEKRVTLAQALPGKKTFPYVYDLGDNSEHRSRGEKIPPPDARPRHQTGLDGANVSLPEDFGGEPGEEAPLNALGYPNHPKREDIIERVASDFTPCLRPRPHPSALLAHQALKIKVTH